MAQNSIDGEIDEINASLVDLPYYQDGETFSITESVYLIGMSGSNGKSYTATIFLPKKIKSGYTITHSTSLNNVRCGTTTLTTGLSVAGIIIRGDNALIISVDSTSTTASNTICNIVPNSITITFHKPT